MIINKQCKKNGLYTDYLLFFGDSLFKSDTF